MKECDVPEVVVGNLVAHDESKLLSCGAKLVERREK